MPRVADYSQLLSRTTAPIVQKDDYRLGSDHVVMNSHHIQAVRTQGEYVSEFNRLQASPSAASRIRQPLRRDVVLLVEGQLLAQE